MTIKDFARLCGCNPKTLRYYDQMELLKPVKVDPWTGYRIYEEEQALLFVKIKNLQKAGFTIGEIKNLLDQDKEAICEALDVRIAGLEKKLQEIKLIRASYHGEMAQMEQKVKEIREKIMREMEAYDPKEEFGIDRTDYEKIIGNVTDFFEGMYGSKNTALDFSEFEENDKPEEEEGYLNFLDNPEYRVVYEKHGWEHVRDFLDEFAVLLDGEEYALYFRMADAKGENMAFMNTMLGILLNRNEGKKRNLGINMEKSDDGMNHFWLLLRDVKAQSKSSS